MLPGNGDGTFRAAVAGGCVSAPDNANVVAGDFNGDGKMDIAFTMEGDRSLNPGAGDAIPVFGKPVHGPARMSVALGTSAPTPAGLGVALGNGDGSLRTPQIYVTDPGWSHLAIADFNGDGINDIVTYNETTLNVSIFLGSAPKWTTTIAPTGSLKQGQVGAQYTIAVNNAGTGLSAGVVNAVVTFPLGGITATAISGGADWTCTLATLSCKTSIARPAGTSYAPIVVTVNISASAPPQVTAAVAVSGGGAPSGAAAQVSSPDRVQHCAALAEYHPGRRHCHGHC